MLHAKVHVADDHASSDAGSDERRAGSDRVAVQRPSTVRAEDFRPRDVVVEDLSSTGFRFVSATPVTIGTLLHVGLGGSGMSQARVVRADADHYGCEFVRPLSEDQLARAFTDSSVLAGAFPALHVAPVMPYRDDRWPGAVRVAAGLGAATVTWVALWRAASLLLG